MRVGIVASRFNEEITGELLKRAHAEAKKLGVEVQVVQVPGALEIPLALQWLASHGCDAGAAVEEAEELVRAYQDSPERAAMLANFARLPHRP